MQHLLTKKQWTLIFLIILFLFLFFFILPISIPLVIGFLTALILNPSVHLLEDRFKLGRKTSVMIVYLIFILVLLILGYFTINSVIGQLVALAENTPNYIVQINQLMLDWGESFEHFMEDLPAE